MTQSKRIEIGPISPLFIVESLTRAIRFYVDSLDFELRFSAPEDEPFFAIVGRDTVELHLKEIGPEVPPQANPSRHECASWDAFVFVRDPDALAAEFANRGVRFHIDLGDRDDGLRGFAIRDSEGYVLYFGHPLD
jgi:catechol 2,3-dioxygenase-like lactoylglutathione lyase family enzyme